MGEADEQPRAVFSYISLRDRVRGPSTPHHPPDHGPRVGAFIAAARAVCALRSTVAAGAGDPHDPQRAAADAVEPLLTDLI